MYTSACLCVYLCIHALFNNNVINECFEQSKITCLFVRRCNSGWEGSFCENEDAETHRKYSLVCLVMKLCDCSIIYRRNGWPMQFCNLVTLTM